MLIDTPDFDSILEDNRIASESLLAVADLVIAVVTRHSYQNRAVVRFLERWLQHGRPWMLVYNEASDAEVAARARRQARRRRRHAAAGGLLGAAQPRRAAAATRRSIPDQLSPGARRRRSTAARRCCSTSTQIAEVKSRAFDAALARLRDALREAAAALAADALRAGAVLQAAEARAIEAGMRVAAAAMPARPFVDAFRTVLDRRSNPLSRSWRTTLRHIRLGIESLPLARCAADAPQPENGGGQPGRRSSATSWPRPGRRSGRSWCATSAARRATRRARPAGAAVARAARRRPRRPAPRRGVRRARRRRRSTWTTADVAEFQRACEQLVERAIEDRGFDLDIQAAADLATLVPIALAAAVIVNTGGLGSDIAAAGGGALGTFLFEKYAHVLGSGIMADARRRWTEVRGRQLAQRAHRRRPAHHRSALRATSRGTARAHLQSCGSSRSSCRTTAVTSESRAAECTRAQHDDDRFD